MICSEKRANFLNSTARALSNVGLKALPVVGAGFSAYDAAKDIGKGDYTGAGLEAANTAIGLSSAVNPFVGVPASMLLSLYTQNRRAKRDQRSADKNLADYHQQLADIQGSIPKQAASNFQRDINDPQAGISSDLYHAVSPLIGSADTAGLSSEDLARQQALQEQVRKGLVGLEYMTGLKQNTGNTYYDEHPAAAVASDLLGNAGNIGAATAAGGLAGNLLNQYRNFKMTRPAQDARTGNYGVDPSHPRNLLNPKGGEPVRADIARVFGDFTTDPETRLHLIDEMNNAAGHTTNFVEDYQDLITRGEDPTKLFQQANKSPGAAKLEDYANFHESAQRAKAQGGFKKYWGEDLHTTPEAGTAAEGKFRRFIREKLAPAHMQGFTDMAEAQGLTRANPQFSAEMLKRIAEEYSPGTGARAFASTGLEDLQDLKLQGSGLAKLIKRTRLPLAAGAAAAVGGTGLHYLVKALQEQSHSPEKMREWKKTLLQSRGDFDRASLYDTPSRSMNAPAVAQRQLANNSEVLQPTDEKALQSEQPSQVLQQPSDSPEIDWSAALNSMR